MEILTKENLVGGKTAPNAVSKAFRSLSKDNQVSYRFTKNVFPSCIRRARKK